MDQIKHCPVLFLDQTHNQPSFYAEKKKALNILFELNSAQSQVQRFPNVTVLKPCMVHIWPGAGGQAD